jgi:hypothetical protein
MKRALASLAGIIGLAALGRWLAQRRHPSPAVADAITEPIEPAEPVDDPAEELRRKLADARDGEPEQATGGEAPESLDERRARVHAKAREAMDAMAGDEAPS